MKYINSTEHKKNLLEGAALIAEILQVGARVALHSTKRPIFEKILSDVITEYESIKQKAQRM